MIVFLHGWGMSKYIFQKFVDTYLVGENVLLLDLPGYGGAEWADDFDRQVAQLVKKIPKGSHLVAWSLAGLYGLRMATLYPDRLSKLTLVSSSPSFVQKIDFKNALNKKLLEQFSQQLITDRTKTIERFLLLQLHSQPQLNEYARALKKIILKGGEVKQKVLEFGLSCLKDIDCREDLRSCSIPILFILGVKDMIVPYSVADDIKKINENINVVVLDGAGHLPFVTHEKTFNKVVFGLEAL